MSTTKIVLPTRRLEPAFVDFLKSLKTGDKIKITQLVRVGGRKWTAETTGTFRNIQYLSTGVTVERVPEDDIIVPTIHFTKENGELASISLDENSRIERI